MNFLSFLTLQPLFFALRAFEYGLTLKALTSYSSSERDLEIIAITGGVSTQSRVSLMWKHFMWYTHSPNFHQWQEFRAALAFSAAVAYLWHLQPQIFSGDPTSVQRNVRRFLEERNLESNVVCLLCVRAVHSIESHWMYVGTKANKIMEFSIYWISRAHRYASVGESPLVNVFPHPLRSNMSFNLFDQVYRLLNVMFCKNELSVDVYSRLIVVYQDLLYSFDSIPWYRPSILTRTSFKLTAFQHENSIHMSLHYLRILLNAVKQYSLPCNVMSIILDFLKEDTAAAAVDDMAAPVGDQ